MASLCIIFSAGALHGLRAEEVDAVEVLRTADRALATRPALKTRGVVQILARSAYAADAGYQRFKRKYPSRRLAQLASNRPTVSRKFRVWVVADSGVKVRVASFESALESKQHATDSGVFSC